MIDVVIPYLVPLLPDVLSGLGFVFLVKRGHQSAAVTITNEALTAVGVSAPGQRRNEIESLICDVSEAHDLQRRTNLAALISIGGALSMLQEAALVTWVVVLLILWVILYYLSSHYITLPTAMSKRDFRQLKMKATRLFAAWWIASVIIKTAARALSL
ncbi:MAG TPA: hypothetical protein VH702_12755 [Vicinamibacterales bacterium]|jgi:hypothetical protein